MSFNYNPPQPIATSSSVASAPVNSALGQMAGAFNQHIAGSQFGHVATSGVGGITLGAAIQGITAAATGATDLWTILDRLANAIGILAGSSSAAGTWASLGGVVSGGGVAQATAVATANTLVRRDTLGGALFGPLGGQNLYGVSTVSTTPALRAIGAAGDPSQFTFAVQNNAGTINKFTVDNLGDVVAQGRITGVADLVVGTVIYAGSAVTQLTDSTGKINPAALPVVDGAHGGMGVDVTVSGNKPTARALLGAAASGANSDITALTGLTTAIGAPLGGTGLISPAAGSIPVTNGSGAWLLLPPTPANYFIVSNGTTYVAQAFSTSMIPNGTLNQSVMSALYPTPGTGAGNLLKVSAAPWQGYINGTWVQFAGGVANYSPAIDPTGIGVGQSRIDLLVLNASGNLAWSIGTPSATPSIVATPVPTNANPIWYFKTYSGATSITGYTDTGSQSAAIQDARNLFGPISSVTGGGGNSTATYATMALETASLPNSVRIGNKFFVMVGADADFTAETDIFALAAGTATGTINGKDLTTFAIVPTIVKTGTNAPDLNVADTYVQGDIPSRLVASGTGITTVVTLQAGSGGSGATSSRVTIALYGSQGRRVRSNTAPVSTTTNIPVATGQTVYLVADLTVAGSGFALFYSATANTPEYQVVLGAFLYDGTNLQIGPGTLASYKGIASLKSNQLFLQTLVYTGTNTALAFSSGTLVRATNDPAGTFYLAEQSKILVISHAWARMTATADFSFVEGYVQFDSAGPMVAFQIEGAQFPAGSATLAAKYYSRDAVDTLTLAAGVHTVQQVWATNNATVDFQTDRKITLNVFAS